jgi:hypothetical protein
VKKHCTAVLIALCAAASLAAQTDTSALTEINLLDVNKYSSYFFNGRKELDSKYTYATTDEDFDRFSVLGGNVIDVDIPLEISLLSYYSQPVINIRPAEAKNILPANTKTSELKLGAAVYQEMQILRFLGNTDAVGRHEGIVKFITDRGNVSRAEIENYLKDGIAEVVDKYYSQRGMYDITPSIVYAEWKQNGVSRGLDGLQIVKDKLAAFYLSPTPEHFAALRGIFASYRETEEKYSDPLGFEAGNSFSRTLRELSNPLWAAVVDDKRTASAAIAAAGSAGRDLGIFSLRYTTGR